MTEVVEGLDRARIAALRESGAYFWVDVALAETSADDLCEALGVPESVRGPLMDFGRAGLPSRAFHADGRHVLFALTCHLDSPVVVHVLATGDFLLTVHEKPLSLPRALAMDAPWDGTERYAVYAVLDAIVGTGFDALGAVELRLEELLSESTHLRAGRLRMATLRDLGSRLAAMRRHVAPQRGIFDRISVELARVRGLEPEDQRYFDKLGAQLNRLIEAIDAAANAMATLIQLRLNETTYLLTVVATVFLPLTFITGFFGMNFGWMVDEVDSALAFWLLGVGSLVIGVALIWRLIVRGTPIQPDDAGAEDRAGG
jgi:magnesium transporter